MRRSIAVRPRGEQGLAAAFQPTWPDRHPAARCHTELLSVPTRERARFGKSQQRSDFPDGTRAVLQVLGQQVPTHFIEQRGKGGAFACQVTRHGPPVDAQVLRDNLHPAMPARQQQDDVLAHPVGHPWLPSWRRSQQAVRVARHYRVGWVPANAVQLGSDLSRWFLAVAVAGIGMKTQLKELLNVGVRPVVLLLVETLFLAGLVLTFLRVSA